LAVVVGAAGVALGFPAADPIAGLIIAGLILVVLQDAARDVLIRIMDGVDPSSATSQRRFLARFPESRTSGSRRPLDRPSAARRGGDHGR
jgi:divalent metal cation (Fe/Co/Zn/Cd) transporter